jgi:hypothetical protein
MGANMSLRAPRSSVYKVGAETFDLLKENPESDSLEVADVRSRKL